MAKIIPFSNNDDPHRNGAYADEATNPMDGRFPGLFLHRLGLSDDQVSALISGDPERYMQLFEIAAELRPGEEDTVAVLRLTRALLSAVGEREPMKATAKGNLPQAVVKELSSGAFSGAEPWYVRVNREDDSFVLSWIRKLAQKAGLLALRKGVFRLTKAGRSAMEGAAWARLYTRLMETHLRHPEVLHRFDRHEDDGAVAVSLPFLLFAARDSTQEYLYEEDFAELLHAVDLGVYSSPELLGEAIALRFFKRFAVPFGLVEPGPPFPPPVKTRDYLYYGFGRWERTERFDRMLHWRVDPPPRAAMPPPAAAARLMDSVHNEARGQIDGSEDSMIERYCLRAIERCPEDADAYVVWARLFERRPELALEIVETGLAASRNQEPDVPEGVSPWADHLFRDVLRLHFTRAEMLQALGRLEEAFEEYERLLEMDPEDGIGARLYYVPALVEAGRYREAKRALGTVAADNLFSAPVWTAVLIEFALGEYEAAEGLLKQAIEANPHTPRYLLSRYPPEPPPYYSPGDESEAEIYADFARKAWRAVPGALDW
ncbi:MAG: tetratricopeptide repeat protein, partial [bacterium]